MAITFHELKARLKQIDEISLLEVLGLTSEDIVERCSDIIEDQYEILAKEFEEDEAEESD